MVQLVRTVAAYACLRQSPAEVKDDWRWDLRSQIKLLCRSAMLLVAKDGRAVSA